MSVSFRLLLGLCLLLPALILAAEDDLLVVQESPASAIVKAALQAEVDGDASRRKALLDAALESEPQHAEARWHSGYVHVNDQWIEVASAEKITAESPAPTHYRKLRDRTVSGLAPSLDRSNFAGSLADELSLARWCRKHGLEDREKLHWTNVVRLDPSNAEARQRLGLREFRGRLMTASQIQDWKQGMQEYQRALDEWNPKLSRWRREIERSSLPQLTDAWQQFTKLDDATAVPSLEKIFYRSDLDFQRKIIPVLGNIQDQIATDALMRISLNTENSELRHAAATELGDRSWFGFVPNLLAQLETPVQYRYVVKTLSAGVTSQLYLTKENPDAVVTVSNSVTTGVPLYIDPERRTAGNLVRMELLQQERIAEEASKLYRQLAASVQAVERTNAQRIVFNDRVYSVLGTSTGQRLRPEPSYWWDWWRDYNEYEDSEEKPYVHFARRRYNDRSIRLRSMSCFVAGTPVWTESGAMSIEDLRVGDRVLSQDPDSGELSYQIVLETTIRPASPTLRLQISGDEIVATLGHPMWVVGRGWTMAKELKPGDQLHGVAGGVTIDHIEPGPMAEAHNLVVAQTNTYFIGKQRLLVHDNMPRRAIDSPLPGWVAQDHVASVNRAR